MFGSEWIIETKSYVTGAFLMQEQEGIREEWVGMYALLLYRFPNALTQCLTHIGCSIVAIEDCSVPSEVKTSAYISTTVRTLSLVT